MELKKKKKIFIFKKNKKNQKTRVSYDLCKANVTGSGEEAYIST